MNPKKFVSILVALTTTLSLSAPAFASTSEAHETPEMTLLENFITLSGQIKYESQDTLKVQVQTVVKNYLSQAGSLDSRAANLKAAAAELGVGSKKFNGVIDQILANSVSKDSKSNLTQSQLRTVLSSLRSRSGAQYSSQFRFSGPELCTIGWIVIAGTSIAAIVEANAAYNEADPAVGRSEGQNAYIYAAVGLSTLALGMILEAGDPQLCE